MISRKKFEIDEYDGRPRGTESALDERKMIASMLNSNEIYCILRDMGIRQWAWTDDLSREVFEEYAQFVEQKGHDRALQCAMGSENRRLTRALRYFVEHEDGSDYINQMRMLDEVNDRGKYGIISIIDTHIQQRRREEAKEAAARLQRKIEMFEPFADAVDDLQKFIPHRQEKVHFTLAEIADMIDDVPDEPACKTGVDCIDDSVKIIEGGCLVAIGGESSAGKTSLVNQIAYNISKSDYGRGIFYSTETDPKRLGNRVVEHMKFQEECGREEATEIMRQHQKLVVTNKITHIDEIMADVRREHKSNAGVRFVYIDYLQNLESDYTGNPTYDLEQTVKKIHKLSQELKIVVFLLAQLVKQDSKANQRKEKPIPTLSSFRGSASLGNAADIAMILQRPEYGKQKAPVIATDLFVIKQKEGVQTMIPLDFVGSAFTFIERGR